MTVNEDQVTTVDRRDDEDNSVNAKISFTVPLSGVTAGDSTGTKLVAVTELAERLFPDMGGADAVAELTFEDVTDGEPVQKKNDAGLDHAASSSDDSELSARKALELIDSYLGWKRPEAWKVRQIRRIVSLALSGRR